MSEKNTQKTQQIKPPVVVILGHVDHGKTTLLDYIRHAKVAEKESGGITQHIGAYQIEYKGQSITFIDTPGHEAFSAMRSRGAKVADLAILVIAAEEGLKPQTKEAIKHIQKNELPFIVALNKIDKKEAQPEKVKNELAKESVFVESLGGKTPAVEISAKSGQGVDELLDLIALMAEIEVETPDDLFSKPAAGVIIESLLDPLSGPSATFLVKRGILKIKDTVATNSAYGRIKNLKNFQLKPIEKAGPSTPVLVLGLNQPPAVGEEWQVYPNIINAKAAAEKSMAVETRKKESREVIETETNKKILNLIIKGDVAGSLEAIEECVKNIPQNKIFLRLLKIEVGDITDSNVKLAESSKAIILGFRVKVSNSTLNLAKRINVEIAIYDIIYELIQGLREKASALLDPEINRQTLGKIKILAHFKTQGNRQIVGGKVIDGKIERGGLIEILRDGEKIGQGRLTQLQHNKADVAEVTKDKEAGLLIESNAGIIVGDILENYKEEKISQEL